MATKTEMKKVIKVEHSKGSGKSTKAKVIALLQEKPRTVPELVKLAGISTAHARTILYGLDDLQKQEALTLYSLPKSK